MVSRLWITMPADVGGLAPLGEALRAALAELQVDPEAVDSVELCVTEAVNDAIERSRSCDRGTRVEVQIGVEAEVLRIVVGDRGARPLQVEPTLVFDPEDRSSWPEGGMGLFLIHQLMTEVQYKSDPTCNVIHMSCALKVP